MKRSISYTKARSNLSNLLNQVCATHEPIVIERREGQNTVILSEEDWNSMLETIYLMGSSKDWMAIIEKVKLDECSDTLPW